MNRLYIFVLLITFVWSAGSNFANKEEINNEHLNQHLENKIDTKKEKTADERRFYYFQQNDPNNDSTIDGLEIIKAIIHEHSEDDTAPDHPVKSWSDDELESQVDSVLAEMDINKDGVIDYSEYSSKIEL